MPKVKAAEMSAAAEACDKKRLQSLVDAGGDVHAVAKGGMSALHLAASKGDTADALACIKILLDAGADCTAENDFGDNPLGHAKKKKFNKVVAVLEEATAAAEAAEAERRKAKAAAKAKAKGTCGSDGASAGGTSGESSLPYRLVSSVGWKPLLKDWNTYVDQWKKLTDDFTDRKVGISFSNKTADATFAKALAAELKAEGADTVKLLDKWPVKTWVDSCVWAADEADFVIIVHSVRAQAALCKQPWHPTIALPRAHSAPAAACVRAGKL